MKVHICENKKTGTKSGYAHEIIFIANDGEKMLQVESINMAGEPLRSTDNIHQYIIYEGQIFKHRGTQWWAGNMMWNGYNMPDDHALGFINALHRSKKWTVSEAWTEIARAWEKADELPGILFELPGLHPAWVNESQTQIKFPKSA